MTVMDICGAMALKTHFANVTTIYVKRSKRALVAAVLEKNLQNAEKVSRLLALDAETKNEEICDYMISGDQPEKAAEQILTSLNLPIHPPKPASRRKKK